jgi:hypothetical protein
MAKSATTVTTTPVVVATAPVAPKFTDAEIARAREILAAIKKPASPRYGNSVGLLPPKAELAAKLPRQARGVLAALTALKGKASVNELVAELPKHIETCQTALRIFTFYRARLIEEGHIACV